jgi:hypothetical protein
MSRHMKLAGLLATVALVAVVGTIAAAMMALVGADVPCGVGGGTALAAGGPEPTKAALEKIPPHWLTMYREAGSAIDISWPFLASIGYQECGHGTGDCYVVNPSGCAGPMEMAYVRGSACSPDPAVPTIWERFKTDGDGDGKAEIFDNADSIFTAAKVLRSDGAPPVGGSFSAYHEAACNYYGACSDPSADYADEVMSRAVEYGFGNAEAESESVLAAEGTATEEGTGEDGPPAGGSVEKEASGGGKVEPRGGRHPGAEGGGQEVTKNPPAQSGSTCEGSFVAFGGGASGGAIVRIARSQIGYTEHGDNCQKYGPCVEWCGLFVAWVWKRAGLPIEDTALFAYSGSFYEWVREHGGRDLPATATPAPGDAVMYGTSVAGHGMDHVGIVERVFPNGEILTIEGNFSNQVEEVGPFDPADAEAAGEPAPIYGYAEPPGSSGSAPEGAGSGGVGSKGRTKS